MSWNRRKIIRPDYIRLAARRRWQRMAKLRLAAGLTTRGTNPKRRLEGGATVECIDSVVVGIKSVWGQIPPSSQRDCIRLCKNLAKMRRQLMG